VLNTNLDEVDTSKGLERVKEAMAKTIERYHGKNAADWYRYNGDYIYHASDSVALPGWVV
jgi:hypothetical protein